MNQEQVRYSTSVRMASRHDSISSTSFTPTLFALLGYEALVHDEMSDQIKHKIAANASLEFLWHRTQQLSAARAQIRTHNYRERAAPQWVSITDRVRLGTRSITLSACQQLFSGADRRHVRRCMPQPSAGFRPAPS